MTVRCYLSGNPDHDELVRSFYDGCPEDKQLVSVADYEESDVAVVCGWFKKAVPASFARGRVIGKQRKRGRDVIVLDTGYLKRGVGAD